MDRNSWNEISIQRSLEQINELKNVARLEILMSLRGLLINISAHGTTRIIHLFCGLGAPLAAREPCDGNLFYKSGRSSLQISQAQ